LARRAELLLAVLVQLVGLVLEPLLVLRLVLRQGLEQVRVLELVLVH
jgi:hypothetical protein